MARSANKVQAAGRLPRRFPVGTKFVIEARHGGDGPVYSRHLEFPDGTRLALPPRRGVSVAKRRRGGTQPDRTNSR